MSSQIEYIKYIAPNSKAKTNLPVTIEWLGSRMIRNHSIKATVKEILTISESLDVVKINIIGNPGTGKTTLAKTLAHLIHKMSEIPYAVKILDRESLLNFEATLKTLQPTNYVLIFDDVSFLGASANKKQVEIVKKAFSEVRHLEGGSDVKIIAIMNFHYSYGLDKFLRQSNFSFYTSVGSSEMDNMTKTLGIQNTQKIEQFQRVTQMALLKKKYAFQLGTQKGKWFVYDYRQPFAPALFFNSMSLRVIAFPKREWIDKLCSVCVGSQTLLLKDGLNVDDFAKQLDSKFGKQIGRNALRIKLFQNGINVYPKRVKQAMRFIDLYMENKIVNMQSLADHYDFDSEPTRLDVKIDEITIEGS